MKKIGSETTGNIYAAVGKPNAWTALMAELCDLFDANIGMLVATGQGQRDHSFYAAHNHSERLARAYSDHWWQHDVWVLAALKIGDYRTGNVAVGTDLVGTADLRASAFYKDFLLAMPAEHLLAAVVADGTDGEVNFEKTPPTHISFFRPPGAVPFTANDTVMLTTLLPHLRRALHLDGQWRAMQEQLNVFHTSVNSMDFGVAFIDAAGRVRHANSAADALAKKLWPNSTQGVADALRSSANKQLLNLVSAAAAGQGSAIKLQSADAQPCQAVAIAMTVANPGASVAGTVRSSVLLLMVDSARRPDAAAEFLTKAFSLSKSESRVLPLLIKGLAPADIAQALGLKLPTVRSQLSAVFAKTGTARQQDLMALASAMPPVADSAIAPLTADF